MVTASASVVLAAFLPIFFAAALFAPIADDPFDRANITNEARMNCSSC